MAIRLIRYLPIFAKMNEEYHLIIYFKIITKVTKDNKDIAFLKEG